jgi:hypothetical protein
VRSRISTEAVSDTRATWRRPSSSRSRLWAIWSRAGARPATLSSRRPSRSTPATRPSATGRCAARSSSIRARRSARSSERAAALGGEPVEAARDGGELIAQQGIEARGLARGELPQPGVERLQPVEQGRIRARGLRRAHRALERIPQGREAVEVELGRDLPDLAVEGGERGLRGRERAPALLGALADRAQHPVHVVEAPGDPVRLDAADARDLLDACGESREIRGGLRPQPDEPVLDAGEPGRDRDEVGGDLRPQPLEAVLDRGEPVRDGAEAFGRRAAQQGVEALAHLAAQRRERGGRAALPDERPAHALEGGPQRGEVVPLRDDLAAGGGQVRAQGDEILGARAQAQIRDEVA